MKHGSLFSGIGGFDLAAEWMEWENVFHCEWNEFGQKVLKYYWPKAISYADITKTDFTIHRGTIDVLTGGFPCQPYSQAGKRKGKEDERHLWPEMLRAIGEIQPCYVVGENVLGLINWNRGMVFDEVQADLEAAGYEVWPYVLPACAVNAPHRRDRVWFIAHAIGDGYQPRGFAKNRCQEAESDQQGVQREWVRYDSRGNGKSGTAPNTESNGDRRKLRRMAGENEGDGESEEHRQTNLQFRNNGKKRDAADSNSRGFTEWISAGKPGVRIKEGSSERSEFTRTLTKGDWGQFPTQPPICSRNDGLSPGLDGITFPKYRNESIKAGGNAIVPQVALQIFKAIEQYNRLTH